MARAADYTFPVRYENNRRIPAFQVTDATIIRMNPVRYGGRSEQGHSTGVITGGGAYWSGTIQLVKRGIAKREDALKLEAMIVDLSNSQKTFRVPMRRQSNREQIKYMRAGSEVSYSTVFNSANQVIFNPKAPHANWTVDETTRFISKLYDSNNTQNTDIRVLAGTRLTVDNELFMVIQDGTITTSVPITVPEWPTTFSNNAVFVDPPFVVGRIPVDSNIQLIQSGPWTGGWVLPWEEQ